MPKAPKTATPVHLRWRTPNPRRYYKDHNGMIVRNSIIRSAVVVGACTISERKTKGRVIQRVQYDCNAPGADPFFVVKCVDQIDRHFYIIIQDDIDRYLLGLYRGSDIVTITQEQTLYEHFPIDIADDISVMDLEFVQKVVSDWLGGSLIADHN